MERYWLETGTKLHKTYESARNYGNDYSAPDGRHEVVFYADAQATVEALQTQVKTARHDAVRAFVRGEDKMCLVCGAKEPCELKDDPCSPCTFDPTPMELKQQVEALQRERDEAIEAASLPTWVCDGCGRVSSEGWINRVIDSFEGTDYEMECPTCGVRAIEEDCASDLVRERDDLQASLDAERERNAQLQALVRAYFTEPDPHKWIAAYQALKRIGRTLDATPTERGQG